MRMMIYNYHPALKIANTEQLPRGTGCTVLECVYAPDDQTLIAKQWRRGEPYGYDAIVRFPGNRFYKQTVVDSKQKDTQSVTVTVAKSL